MNWNFRSLWIAEEKELVHEIAGLGELRGQWHTSQMSWLDGHLNLINTYNTNLENTDNYRGMRDIIRNGIGPSRIQVNQHSVFSLFIFAMNRTFYKEVYTEKRFLVSFHTNQSPSNANGCHQPRPV